MAVQQFECGDFLLFQVSYHYAQLLLKQIFAEIVNITQENRKIEVIYQKRNEY